MIDILMNIDCYSSVTCQGAIRAINDVPRPYNEITTHETLLGMYILNVIKLCKDI